MYDVVMQSNGRNKLILSHFEYEFCDDLWRHIKSFIKRPIYVERRVALLRQEYYDLCNINTDDIESQFNIMRLIELYCVENTISHKDKRLTILMNKIRIVLTEVEYLNLDMDYIPIQKGLNRELYKEIREKIIKDHNNSYYKRANCSINYVINNARPYESKTGAYVFFDGRIISADIFENVQKYSGLTRQRLIDNATKEIMSEILVSSICQTNK
jgi:hypothetical protein